MLKITSLSKRYGSFHALKDINLSFCKGEIHGIVGANGAGKTSLFKCICGLESFDGKVEYDKSIIKNVTGYLPTDPYFFSNISGYEYLQLLCNARNQNVADFDSLNLFSLPLSKYAETFSTGMQKQLAITGILLQKNEIFILDEPFNGIDISSSQIIKEILIRLKQSNKIIILSSHILSYLQELCDFVHYLKEGKIIKTFTKGQEIAFKIEETEKAKSILNSLL
jgi:ABC-2 type transport system ATP-binding protein